MVQISERKLTDIRPYERNPRKNDSAVKYVANSIREFGFKVPIVIDANGVIVAGHTRYKAAKQLGMKTVPCVVADDLNDEQIAAFRLADNKTAELAEWDADLLTVELDDIAEIDMSDFGFYENDDPDEIPTDLDAEDDEDDSVRVKLTFPNVKAFSRVENQIKDIVESAGAEMAIIRND